eukprot:2475342-Amphidinium_carterae.2
MRSSVHLQIWEGTPSRPFCPCDHNQPWRIESTTATSPSEAQSCPGDSCGRGEKPASHASC